MCFTAAFLQRKHDLTCYTAPKHLGKSSSKQNKLKMNLFYGLA